MLEGRKSGGSWYGVVVVESMVDAGEGRVVRGGQFGSSAVSAWQMLVVVSVLVFGPGTMARWHVRSVSCRLKKDQSAARMQTRD